VVVRKTINQTELLEMLRGIKGNTFATITTETEPAQKKGSPFKTDLRKVARVNVCAGFHYSNAVNNQEKREGMDGTFLAHPRVWGVRIAGTPIVENKGSFYLEAKIERSMGHIYRVQNRRVIKSEVTPFLRDAVKPATQSHLEKIVILRDYKLENIKRIRMGKNVVNVV